VITGDERAKTPRGSILVNLKTRGSSQPHGRIGHPTIIAADFTTAPVRESQYDAMDVAKQDIR